MTAPPDRHLDCIWFLTGLRDASIRQEDIEVLDDAILFIKQHREITRGTDEHRTIEEVAGKRSG